MNRLRYALAVGLQQAHKKYKSSRLSQHVAIKLVPRVFPSLVLAAAAPKVALNNHTPCPTDGLGETSKSAADLAPTSSSKTEELLVKHECRQFYVVGNLKMYVTKTEIDEIVKRFKKAKIDPKVEVVLVPPIVYLQHVKSVLPKGITLAAPNCHYKGKGPYTGEVSPLMVKEVGADWVVIGQSERRRIFGEKDEIVGQKICRALYDGLKIIVCVGENIEAREKDGDNFCVLEKQLRTIASHVNEQQWCSVVLVYEPTWAFGTGKKCLPEDAQAAHEFIRDWIETNVNPEVAESMRIIYGGVIANGKEAKLYAREEDIDGFFVGYQTVKPEFIDIVNVIQDTNKEIEEKNKARAKELKARKKAK